MDLRYRVFFSKANNGYIRFTFESVFAVFMYFGIMFLLLFVPVAGIALSIFLMGYLCTCYKGFYINLLENKKPKLEEYFINIKYAIKAFILKFSTMLISFLWMLLLIIPGIISLLNYSFVFNILADDKSKDVQSIMRESKMLTNGVRGEIFLIYLTEVFVATLIGSFFTSLVLILKTYISMPQWLIISLPIICTAFVLALVIIPYFEMMLSSLYITVKNAKLNPKSDGEKKTTRKKQPSNATSLNV